MMKNNDSVIVEVLLNPIEVRIFSTILGHL